MSAVLNVSTGAVAPDQLTAVLTPERSLQATLTPGESLSATISQGPMIIGNCPDYDGPYEIRPAVQPQELLTAEKRMKDNLLILEIPYAEVTNTSGGMTATIG